MSERSRAMSKGTVTFLDPIFTPLEVYDPDSSTHPLAERSVRHFQGQLQHPVTSVTLSYKGPPTTPYELAITTATALTSEDINWEAGVLLTTVMLHAPQTPEGEERRLLELECHRRAASTDWTPAPAPFLEGASPIETSLLISGAFWITINRASSSNHIFLAAGHVSYNPADLAVREVSSWMDYGGETTLPWRRRVRSGPPLK